MKQANRHTTRVNDEKIIVWEKWHNPYLPEDGWEETRPLTGHDENDFKPKRKKKKPPWIGNRVIMSPHGIIPVTEYNNPTASFNLWTGHTNFPLTHEAFKIIASTIGVESLDIITPYRFRLGVGTLFSAAQVCEDIVNRLNECMSDNKPTLTDRVREFVYDQENAQPVT